MTDTYEDFMDVTTAHDEEPVLVDMLNELSKTDVMWDVGAKIGLYGLFASDVVEDGSVSIFEPDPYRASKTIANNSLNSGEVDIFNVALGETSEYVGFSANRINESASGYACRSERGDALVDEGVVERPSVVKIDVEGAEGLVLAGLEESLSESLRAIYCEVHPRSLPGFGMGEEELFEMLASYGFEGRRIETPRKTGDAYLVKFEK